MNVGSEQHRRDHGQPLHHLVLIVGDLRLVEVAHAREQVAREVQAVGCAQQLVVGVGEVQLDLAREQRDVAVELDPVVEHGAARVA